MSLSVLNAAAEKPELPALVLDGRVLTFADLAERVRSRMAWLSAQGVLATAAVPRPVALVARPELAVLECLYALFELGVPALLVHPRLTAVEQYALLTAAGVGAPLEVSALPFQAPVVVPAAPSFTDERPLAIVYTSGSSGAPKGIVLGRGAFRASAQASAQNLGWQPDDRWLLALPPAHVGGLSIVTRCLIARRAVVLTQPERGAHGIDACSLAAVVERERVTLLSLVPTLLARLLELSPPVRPPKHLRAILLGGAAAPLSLLERAAARGWPVLTTYGLTETCSQVTAQRLGQRSGGQGDAGHPLPGVEVRVVAGRIQVRGTVLFSAYYPSGAHPELRDGWFETGDFGSIDGAGALHVTGRASEVIITGGENVWPSEVEAALLECTGVSEACVFGVHDDVWGELVAAAVVVTADARFDRARLARELGERLASFKRPRRIAVVESLPLTASGKMDRAEVKTAAIPKLVSLA